MPPPPVRKGALDVYLLDCKVGRIDYTSHRNEMIFAYDEAYAASPDAVPLSFSLPLSEKSFDSDRTTTFFENLLPPDSVRKRLGPVLHISHHNIFGFLEAIGGDCAGAISLWRSGESPHKAKPRLLTLDEDRADEVLRSLRKRPLYVNGVDGYRISGAGAQSKLIARIEDGAIKLPLFGTPSTHIIKPSVADYPDSIYNELYSMRLAAAIGLPTADAGLLRVKGNEYYWTGRFDRERVDGEIRRLHQEDFCQILGVHGELKYESDGGPGFADCMSAMREMKLGLSHQLAFIDRMIFNFLIGNADAHAKNSSVLYRNGKAGLAPIYDVMSTVVYPHLSKVNAMSIGGAKEMREVSRGSFGNMADEVGMSAALVLGRLDALVKRILPAARALASSLSVDWPSEVYLKILSVVQEHARRLSA